MAKWIQKAIKRPGALRKELGTKEGEPIPAEKLEGTISSLQGQAEKGDLPEGKKRLLKQAVLARTLRGMKRK